MSRNLVIQVFEHDTLQVGQQGFSSAHFRDLVKLSERMKVLPFKVGHNRLKFGSYAGVIQIGNVCIEILPKADKDAVPDANSWRGVLIKMLQATSQRTTPLSLSAELKPARGTLLDVFLNDFIEQVETLVRQGLQRQYILEEGALNFYRGRVNFSRHASKFAGDSTRIWAEYNSYNLDHPLHRIIVSALRKIPALTRSTSLIDLSRGISELFADICRPSRTDIIKVKRNSERFTARYKRALSYALMILGDTALNPQQQDSTAIAIIFDMNILFEDFVTKCIRVAAQGTQFDIKAQVSSAFFEKRTIRPDVLVEVCGKNVVIDTKWKVIDKDRPADSDLKQIFVYNNYFESAHSLLVFPRATSSKPFAGRFQKKVFDGRMEFDHFCSSLFVDLFADDGGARSCSEIGKSILEAITMMNNNA